MKWFSTPNETLKGLPKTYWMKSTKLLGYQGSSKNILFQRSVLAIYNLVISEALITTEPPELGFLFPLYFELHLPIIDRLTPPKFQVYWSNLR